MKRTIALLAAMTLFALPAAAARKPPPIDPLLIARAQQASMTFMEQDVTLTALTSVTVDAGAHTAHISGTGTASFDNGATALGGAAAPIDMTIASTADQAWQPCQDSLSKGVPPGATVSISGNGFYHVEMQNGSITKASVTIQQLMGCTVSQ